MKPYLIKRHQLKKKLTLIQRLFSFQLNKFHIADAASFHHPITCFWISRLMLLSSDCPWSSNKHGQTNPPVEEYRVHMVVLYRHCCFVAAVVANVHTDLHNSCPSSHSDPQHLSAPFLHSLISIYCHLFP